MVRTFTETGIALGVAFLIVMETTPKPSSTSITPMPSKLIAGTESVVRLEH